MIPATSNHHTQQNTTTNDELEVPKWLALQNTKHTATSSRGLIISANKHDTTMDSSEYSMDACVWMHKQARIKHARAVHRKQDGALLCHLMFFFIVFDLFFSFQCAPLECSFGILRRSAKDAFVHSVAERRRIPKGAWKGVTHE